MEELLRIKVNFLACVTSRMVNDKGKRMPELQLKWKKGANSLHCDHEQTVVHVILNAFGMEMA